MGFFCSPYCYLAHVRPENCGDCLMRKGENHCGDCGGKFGLVHHHAMLKFCRKACKDNFLAKL
jgi:hypothetical protein